MAEVRAVTMKQERVRGSVRSLAICSQLPLFSGEWKDCEELRPKPKEK